MSTQKKFKCFDKQVGEIITGALFVGLGICAIGALIFGVMIGVSSTIWQVILYGLCSLIYVLLAMIILDWYGRNYWRLRGEKPVIIVKYDMVMDVMAVLSSDDADRCVEVVTMIDDGIDEYETQLKNNINCYE